MLIMNLSINGQDFQSKLNYRIYVIPKSDDSLNDTFN